MRPFSKNTVSVSLWITIAFCFGSFCDGGKILVVPLEGSHWVNMEVLIKALHGQGHSVDVIRTYNSWFVKENSTYYNSITIPNTKGIDEEFIDDMLNKLIDYEKGKSHWLSIVWLQLDLIRAIYKTQEMICQLITNIFESEEILKTLKEKQYDLVLTDPVWGAGIILAHKLKLPMVYNVRWSATGEGHFDIAPSPMSYIPVTGSRNTDKMNFFQRELLQGADIWLMRVDFVFEFPRPTMPNIIYIGGFQCKPANALPHDLENFMQSSGEHGVIIMSLGSFISVLPDELTAEIATAFARLPQKVIWRYTGKRPSTLGNNTLLVDWMPQNDLLGHPKTKLFIAHGGTNGVQEALYHGVPVVGIPFFFDQYDNLLRLQERGGAKIVTIGTLDKNTLYAAIQEVISDPSYRLSMQRLSHLHRDTPVKPLDSALFWIEFVMRHKGAAHLRSESYKLPC
ncbi:UDP-glucuronosyltransferase 2A3 [Labeo rohita]|uniref:UDP-glucuronosyltransferase n=1 Tax=Labeo rohita TaxID=84645 RepID=A0ABQ8LU90_LABRO|nr:UDP-glucuronosyltransferase 2A3 [Labeo rohita]